MEKLNAKYIISKIIRYTIILILFVYAVSLFMPLLWALNSSLKDQVEYSTYNLNGLPENWLFENYGNAFTALKIGNNNFFSMIINSVWYSIGGALIGIIVSSMVAYVVAKYEFPGRNFIYTLAIVTMMIPIVGSQASQYRVYSALRIVNSPMILISFAGGFGFNFLVLYAYFRNLPWSYAEAAFIDGAGHVRVFFEVMIPQALPSFMALTVVAVIGLWNDYTTPLLFLKDYPTLSSGLYMFQMITTRQMNMPVLYAGLLISALPILVLFILFSNKIMDISVSGGLKG